MMMTVNESPRTPREFTGVLAVILALSTALTFPTYAVMGDWSWGVVLVAYAIVFALFTVGYNWTATIPTKLQPDTLTWWFEPALDRFAPTPLHELTSQDRKVLYWCKEHRRWEGDYDMPGADDYDPEEDDGEYSWLPEGSIAPEEEV